MWYRSASFVSHLCLRVSLGLSLLLIGISLYRDFAPFWGNVTVGLGNAQIIGSMWAYILPALLIFSGGMLIIGRYSFITAWSAGLGLGSIPVGMSLKTLMSNFPLPEVIEFVSPMFIWMLVYFACVNMPQPEMVVSDEDEES